MIDIPDVPLEEFEVPSDEILSELGLKNEYTGSVEYGVLGSGQAGGRIAQSFYDIGYKKCLALNTAVADLNPLALPDEQKMRIGEIEGSGKNMVLGERATKSDEQKIYDKIKSVFGTVDKIIICVGCGGGTGAGGLKVLVEVATKYLTDLDVQDPATKVIVVAALPTTGELKSIQTKDNHKIIMQNMNGMVAEQLVGPIILIDNARIEKMYRNIPMNKFWGAVNGTIASLFQMFNYLSKQESEYTSFDAQDYKTVLNTPGIAVMGVTKVNGPISQALQDNLKKTVLSGDVDFSTAKRAACILVLDNESIGNLSMDTISHGIDTIHVLLGSADVMRGIYSSDKEGIRAYTLITGMNPVKNTSGVY